MIKFWLARLFGKRFEAVDWHDGTTRVIGYRWRGNLYITDIKEGRHDRQNHFQ